MPVTIHHDDDPPALDNVYRIEDTGPVEVVCIAGNIWHVKFSDGKVLRLAHPLNKIDIKLVDDTLAPVFGQ